MVQWSQVIHVAAKASFTLPTGERLVHVPATLGLHPVYYTHWAFHPVNPWRHRFDGMLYRVREAGLGPEWKERSE